jgi:hypothetical protein
MYTEKSSNKSKNITLNQTEIDIKARQILANQEIKVNDTKVNMDAKKTLHQMEKANVETEKATK